MREGGGQGGGRTFLINSNLFLIHFQVLVYTFRKKGGSRLMSKERIHMMAQMVIRPQREKSRKQMTGQMVVRAPKEDCSRVIVEVSGSMMKSPLIFELRLFFIYICIL